MIRVSAGIVCREDGRILLCRRGEGRRNAHLWEFPGGKQETGESPADCLKRELMEELSLPVTDVTALCSRQEGEIHFDFLLCRSAGEPVRTEHEDMVWAEPRTMGGYDYCPADAPVAHAIALSRAENWVWDFDGTLADTYPMMIATMEEAAALHGIHPGREAIASLLAIDSRTCCRVLQAQTGVDGDRLRRDFCAMQDIDRDCPLMPGVAQVLRQTHAAGIRHYLLTNRSTRCCDYLQRNGLLTVFSGWVTEDDGFPPKPDPTGMRALLARFGLNPHRTVMIGDRDLDMAAAAGGDTMGLLVFPQQSCTCRPCMEAADGDTLQSLTEAALTMRPLLTPYLG